eukprot:6830526-Pyramimonas_sp.AAC.1
MARERHLHAKSVVTATPCNRRHMPASVSRKGASPPCDRDRDGGGGGRHGEGKHGVGKRTV